MAGNTASDEPDIPDFVAAIAAALKGEGVGYLEAQSMVRHMLEEAWDDLPFIEAMDPPTDAVH
jgi:hypothetical protein